MHLYLMQHGEAVPKEVNADRPLTQRGGEVVKRMARYLEAYPDIHVDVIFHSGKTRAAQTAMILGKVLKPSGDVIEGKELSPTSLPWGWVERLKSQEQDVLIVGHLPHLRRLNALLICQDENKPYVEFQYAAVCHLTRDESGIWTIGWMVIPSLVS
jgi:phosphohistidine phosphatase